MIPPATSSAEERGPSLDTPVAPHGDAERRGAANTAAPPLPYILVIDDTPINCQLLTHALRKDYLVRTASSGEEGLAILGEERKPDLILLDIMMPGMDGYEVCRRIKGEISTRNIPVIFVTALDQPRDQQQGFALGAVDYISKPFDILLVKARVAVHVRLKLKSEMLERMAFVDGLTDIPNRRALETTLSSEWARAQRSGGLLSLLMIDIDMFKAYNDCCGHGLGDVCLRRVAHELRAGLLRCSDFVGRYGGEEFLAILPDCDAPGALLVGERLRRRVAELNIPHPQSQVADVVTISIGAASCRPRQQGVLSEFLSEADRALYAAKSRGRNRVCAGLH
ncbi:diguanylate cyclase [Rhodocyclus purpureus]|uniref:diguanylate cyclase n=1 Tax=Rhodocyclus purpureus TaxID=1067 RepID=UPI001912E49F|nr:diguanylate cyclase [Rhodocyclus purpureus]MBK5913357.1 hypothetical protein [Rhodocyclus purpureus]